MEARRATAEQCHTARQIVVGDGSTGLEGGLVGGLRMLELQLKGVLTREANAASAAGMSGTMCEAKAVCAAGKGLLQLKGVLACEENASSVAADEGVLQLKGVLACEENASSVAADERLLQLKGVLAFEADTAGAADEGLHRKWGTSGGAQVGWFVSVGALGLEACLGDPAGLLAFVRANDG
eukprot:1145010-Pelagomonas_calceolata.AAC.3